VTRDVKASTLVLGEVLIDFFSGPADRSVPGARVFPFEGVPGGAPANVAAHLAVRGLPVSLITGFADDPLGEELKQMLAERGIDLTHCLTYPQSRSPLATVISLPDGERTFRLYLEGSCLEKLTPALLTPEVWNGVDWVHFGSVMMAFRGPNELTHALAAGAKERGIVVSFDVNIRADLWLESDVDPRTIVDVLPHVDVLKVSEEDFAWLQERFEGALQRPEDLLERGPALVAYTRGPEGAILFTRDARVEVAPPKVQVVDTTGAGDAFTAGIIYSLKEEGIRSRGQLEAMTPGLLRGVGQDATGAAAAILVQRGALPPQHRPQ